MSRELKYRAKGVDGEWWYGEIASDVYVYRHVNLATFFANLYAKQFLAETLTEYTGLKDRNGKEIFDSDLISGYEGVILQVTWQTDRWECLDVKAWARGLYDAYIPLSEIGQVGLDHQFTNDYLKVIGNVFENADLLQQEAK